jgi:ADP-heptose:LPS heptosyltransferase
LVTFKNILVIQTAFIGDAILASSLVEKLHYFFPSAGVSILVRKGNEGIYHDHPFLKEVLVWNKKEHKLKNLFILFLSIRRNKYDCVINCHRFASSGFLTGFSGAKHTAGYKQTPFSYLFNTSVKHIIGDGRHETSRYNQLIEDFTDDKVFLPKLYPSQRDLEITKKFRNFSYVCIAPASVWFTKQLPADKWVELCDKSKASTIYLLGALGDKILCEKIRESSTHQNIKILASEITLLQSCALMQYAEMNYVNDSAPLHLASSVNGNVTAFFTSTVPEFGFGPLSENAVVKQVDGLPCKPCGLHGYKACPEGHFKCGHLMEV